MLADLRYAARTVARRPVFAITATLTLALGIATATAIFSLVDGILLRSLPYPGAERLVEVLQSYPEKGLEHWPLSHQNAAMYMGVHAFESFAVHARTGVTFDDATPAERLVTEIVSGDFFNLLGVKPLIGRTIGRDDDRAGHDNVAVLSYGVWQSHFGGSPSVIGRTIHLNGQPIRVVGVMPSGFTFPKPDVELYLPLALDPTRARPFFLSGLGRLRVGASPGSAASEATRVMWDWARDSQGLPASVSAPERTHMRVQVTPLRNAMTGAVARSLTVLQAAVMVILLIAVANVATLLTSRGVTRGREIAVRAALGASRTRIATQMLVESLMLAVIGGLVGVSAALAIVRVFSRSPLASLPRMDEVGVSWHVLAFATVISVASGILFGLIPALSLDSGALSTALTGQRASAGRGSRVTTKALIVSQVALSVVLLVAAGLIIKSFRRLLSTDLGFEPTHVVSATVPLPPQRYAMNNRPRAFAFVEQVVPLAEALPEVRAAAVMFPALYVNDVNSDGFLVEGQPAPTPNTVTRQTVQYSVSPGLFRALQIPMLAGRDVSAADRAGTPPVVVVDEALVSQYWSPSGAIGKKIRMTGDTTWWTIVGVVRAIRDESVADAPRPHTYFPYAQYGGSRPTIVLRSNADPAAVVAGLRRVIAGLDPGIAVDAVHPVASAISASLTTRRIVQILLTAFASMAILLAACGLYGVLSLYVANRSREFGIRAAIGASPGQLVRIVVGEGLAIVGLGAGGGVTVCVFGTRALRSLLYGVAPTDTAVYVAAVAVLGVATAAACCVPAWRAAHADPLLSIRAE